MSVSRKNRSMKKTSKSSKRSKNARTSKKTRKYMRKHRGGKSVNRNRNINRNRNRNIDYILYHAGGLNINNLKVGTKFYIKNGANNYDNILTITSIDEGNNDNGRKFIFSDEVNDSLETYERGNNNVTSFLNIYDNDHKVGNVHNLYYVL